MKTSGIEIGDLIKFKDYSNIYFAIVDKVYVDYVISTKVFNSDFIKMELRDVNFYIVKSKILSKVLTPKTKTINN
jgi:hypothetical protein|tara:strand:+ start:165 stop:389 length:225 start_codon:yes stop_codon:yes gene_type:complete